MRLSDDLNSLLGIVRVLGRVKKELRVTRYFTYVFVSIWKVIAFFITSLLILQAQGQNVGHLFSMMGAAFSDHKIIVHAVRQAGSDRITDLSEIIRIGETEVVNADYNTPIYVLLLQIFGAYFAYVFGK